jgi:hypothetical protein
MELLLFLWENHSVAAEMPSHCTPLEAPWDDCTPLDAPWDDMRAQLDGNPASAESSFPKKGDEVNKKSGRKVGRGKIGLVGRSRVLLNSKSGLDGVKAVLILIFLS